MSKILETINLYKSFYINKNKLDILKDINIEIKRGEFVSIMGPSGAGKSTLLYALGLLSKPDYGQIIFKEENISKLSDSKKATLRNQTFGFIFQNYHLLPEFSAIENIILPSIYNGVSKKQALNKAYELLEKVNLKNRAIHKPYELSGGEQQRVCICRALINNPKIIFADEPTGNLDTQNAELVETMLENLAKEFSVTLIVVTHNNDLAKRADNIINLIDGEIDNK